MLEYAVNHPWNAKLICVFLLCGLFEITKVLVRLWTDYNCYLLIKLSGLTDLTQDQCTHLVIHQFYYSFLHSLRRGYCKNVCVDQVLTDIMSSTHYHRWPDEIIEETLYYILNPYNFIQFTFTQLTEVSTWIREVYPDLSYILI